MTGDELIGTMRRTPRGALVVCRAPGCDWKLEKSSYQQAEDSLRGHAALSHPPTIKIYR